MYLLEDSNFYNSIIYMINFGIDVLQAVPKGKARIYKNCLRYVPFIGNYTNDYIDLEPGVYNDVTLKLKDLKDKVYGVVANGVKVELYKETDFSDSPHIVLNNSKESLCLPELWKGRTRGIKIIATEGFSEIYGINIYKILLIILLLAIIYYFYSK